MPPIASRAIWFEKFPELVIRWYRQQGEAVRTDAGSPAEAAMRAEDRAAKVMAFGDLDAPRHIRTLREWETRWNVRAVALPLEQAIVRCGRDVIRHRGPDSRLDILQDAFSASERESVVLVDEALERELLRARESGLELPMTVDDMAAIQLAREAFELLSDGIGSRPRPWVDELAIHAFAERVLGLPFSPLVWRFL